MYSFSYWNQSVVPRPVLTDSSWPAYRFLKREVRWSGIPLSFRILPHVCSWIYFAIILFRMFDSVFLRDICLPFSFLVNDRFWFHSHHYIKCFRCYSTQGNQPDHLTCLLRNLYAGQEATVRTGRGSTDRNNIPNKKRSTSRLYIVTLLI